MKPRKILSIIVVGLCLVLFYSLHLMTNNIDKDRMLSSSESEDKRMLMRFKDNVVQLRNQIEENEVKIAQIKDLLGNMQIINNKKSIDDKKDLDDKIRLETNVGVLKSIKQPFNNIKGFTESQGFKKKFENGDVLKCPANIIKGSNQADIQMAQMMERLAFDNPDGGVWKQGYPIKTASVASQTEKLKVFVIPHSHCDPGWIKTFEQYFNDQTSHILNLAVEKLMEYPSMRFVYAEISYFNLWWKTLSTDKKHIVKNLLKEGRLEVVTGGWVMTDEANSHYFAMLDQMIEGNQWLYNQLDYQAKSGWSIDPFGHSPMMAYLLKRMGFENMLIQRTHYAVKKELSLHKNLEFYWRQNWDDTGGTDMLCHMMPFYSYDVPHTCGPDPKICCQFDFRRSHGSRFSCPWKINPMTINDQNVNERASTLLDQYRKKASLYNNNIVLVPLGDDFRYEVSEEWDKQHNNYAKLFKFMNEQEGWNVEVKFATLSEYFDELRKRQGGGKGVQGRATYPSLSGDFFVYADRDDHYWSGYFTSRPFYKKLDRELEHHQRTAELLFSLALATSRASKTDHMEASDLMATMVLARRTLGLFQHHDAITGTSKTFVVDDYGGMLLTSITALKRVIRSASQYLLLHDTSKFQEGTDLVFDVDESRQHHSEIPAPTVIELLQAERKVYFYNSLGQSRRSLVTVHVTCADVEVVNEEGVVVQSQVDPVWNSATLSDVSDTHFKLHFVADVPAMGFVSFKLKRVRPGSNPHNQLSVIKLFNTDEKLAKLTSFKVEYDSEASIENEQVKVVISPLTGLAQSLECKEGGEKMKMEVEFVRYGTTGERDKSGAYLFLPGHEASPINHPSPKVRMTEGALTSEATTLLPLVRHSIRCSSVQAGVSSMGLDVVNLVDIRDTSNTELAMRIITDVTDPHGTFFTDLNGFQVIKRRYQAKLPIQANFYPMASLAYLEDQRHRITLLTGQALAIASLKPGWLEVMQDRRLNQDDNRGMEQGVTDNKITPNHFRVLFETLKGHSDEGHDSMGFMTMKAHFSSLDLLYPLYILPLSSRPLHETDLRASCAALKEDLPCDIHLVNLRSLVDVGGEEAGVKLKVTPSKKTAIILHRTAFSCQGEGVSPLALHCSEQQASISSLFSDLKVTQVQKTTLNLLNKEEEEEDGQTTSLSHIPPMEIKAYVFQFEN